jgi:hypothetical protein
MVRIVLGVVAGFFGWLIAWFGSEKILSAIWPEGFGVHQRAFEAAITNGGQFTANSRLLLIHIVLASIVSVFSGFLAARIAAEHMRVPLILGCLLLAMGGTEGGYVLAVCSPLVSRYFYGAATSDDDYRR